MNIVNVRRISQAFFLALFLWFCIVGTFGQEWWQLRGWPVNWFLQLDPLTALGTVLTTGTLYAGLAWAIVTIVATLFLGRFFCGWVCPFGSMHQAVGYLGRRAKPLSHSLRVNSHHPLQSIKYYLLLFLLAAASGSLLAAGIRIAWGVPLVIPVLAAGGIILAGVTARRFQAQRKKAAGILLALVGAWTVLAFFFSVDRMLGASLLTGLLDPIPLVHRSVNLVLLPLADATIQKLSVSQRYTEGAWLIGSVFAGALLLNLVRPRFYCRFVCPLGALFGVISRYSVWRIGRTSGECTRCGVCDAGCEGACEPSSRVRIHECVLCMNCLNSCSHDLITFGTAPSASGQLVSPDMSRRGFVLTLVSGVAVVPAMRLGGYTAKNWNPVLIRPPGSLSEIDFLSRCIKCGQCMRVCPTNIIHPAGLQAGFEGLWTPVLNFRIGSSGCQMNCIACCHVCPTAAIRPISLDEKLGRNAFHEAGPIRLGTAFVDHGRCLPWAMDKPCIVCQENCPVSPKAIHVKEHFVTVRDGIRVVTAAAGSVLDTAGTPLKPGGLATGDYYLRFGNASGEQRHLIFENTERGITVDPGFSPEPGISAGETVEIQVRLQRPQVDPDRCIGCGVCEHECPVSGKRAIRVTAENESRNRKHSLLL